MDKLEDYVRYLPTEQDIERERDRIKAAWTEKQRKRRLAMAESIPWKVPVLHLTEG